MSVKRQVRVRVESNHERETTVQEFTGVRLVKGRYVYVRYEERTEPVSGGESARTMTTVKIGDDELKIIRHGHVQSEQSFRAGRKLPGFYRSPYAQFQLSTYTRELQMDVQEAAMRMAWVYDLFVHGECTGRFAVQISIQEESGHES
ncbi:MULTISPECIES: DUF1934 domain-containing protein [unclassified Paenibacillus]|uniref:DUF1934 domain-containing protein n=1 Tax=unclassified Paenibacillus TaxID=185978 RepID=UPI001C0FE170|nr:MULTISPECIES: DUF1934 domain-containing protein [unclassified Paenibacillus]MBU5444498.1 DUF1934 domain-containing protein [Paenibacillus sp. MSJ-34]CAH0122331.1 hypothetical protein PAE9249_04880 [Paenibacillus sp. CECT 9249]